MAETQQGEGNAAVSRLRSIAENWRFPLAPRRPAAYIGAWPTTPRSGRPNRSPRCRIRSGKACATAAGAAAWSSLKTRTPPRSISPTSAAACWTAHTCRCRDYPNRTARVDDCVRLTAKNLGELNWLPVDLRLSPARQRPRPLLVAPARLRRPGERRGGWHISARPPVCRRGRAARRQARRPHRVVAEPAAQRGARSSRLWRPRGRGTAPNAAPRFFSTRPEPRERSSSLRVGCVQGGDPPCPPSPTPP